jgi:hypothetical protein
MPGEQPHAVVERTRRGLEAAGDQLVHQVLELGDGQRLGAVLAHVRMHQRRDEIGRRLRSALLEHRGEVMLRFEFDLHGLQEFVVGQRSHREGEHGLRPPVETMDLGAVESELLGDDDAGQRHGEVHVELALSRVDQPVDEIPRDLVDVRRHLLDASREERLGDEAAIVGVDGRIGSLQRLDVPPTPLAQDLLIATGVVDLQPLLRAAAAAAAGEQLGIGEHEAHVLVAGHHDPADLGHREHRAPLVQLAVEVPRVVLDHGIEHRAIDRALQCTDAVLQCGLGHDAPSFQ